MLVNTKFRLQVKHFTDIIGKPKRSTGNLKPKVQASTPPAARSQREEARRQAATGPAFEFFVQHTARRASVPTAPEMRTA